MNHCLWRIAVGGIGLALMFSAHAARSIPTPTVEGPLADSAHLGVLVWNVEPLGYVAEEYILSGKADVYAAVAMADAANMLTRDNVADMARRSSYVPQVVTAAQPYSTRIILYRPRDRQDFSGNVIVETAHPLQGGRAIVWSQLSGYFAQHGDIYISMPHPSTLEGLKRADPKRYGALQANDNAQLWDMLAQLGALLKSDASDNPLRGDHVRHLYMTGYSFTGAAAASFANFHHDRSRLPDGRPLFDGYLPMADSMYVRPLDVPVLRVMTQSDFNSFDGTKNRRDDSDAPDSRFRLWVVAGASHVNTSPILEPAAAPWQSATPLAEPANLPNFSAQECTRKFPSGSGANDLPLTYVMISAFEHMYAWVDHATPPPHAARIATHEDGSVSTDADGNALGGLRLPQLSAPDSVYGAGTGECFLYGYRLRFTPQQLHAHYATPAEYQQKVSAAVKEAAQQGWLRPQEAQLIESGSRAP
jgi:hypothetical protein